MIFNVVFVLFSNCFCYYYNYHKIVELLINKYRKRAEKQKLFDESAGYVFGVKIINK